MVTQREGRRLTVGVFYILNGMLFTHHNSIPNSAPGIRTDLIHWLNFELNWILEEPETLDVTSFSSLCLNSRISPEL